MQYDSRPAIALPVDVRQLLEAPNYVHLSTLRADGRPRNHVVWAGLEGERVLICTSDWTWKAKDMRRDPRVALSVIDRDNPYRMAALQGQVVEERPPGSKNRRLASRYDVGKQRKESSRSRPDANAQVNGKLNCALRQPRQVSGTVALPTLLSRSAAGPGILRTVSPARAAEGALAAPRVRACLDGASAIG